MKNLFKGLIALPLIKICKLLHDCGKIKDLFIVMTLFISLSSIYHDPGCVCIKTKFNCCKNDPRKISQYLSIIYSWEYKKTFDKQICFEKHKTFWAKTNNSEAIKDDDLEEEVTIPATTCWVKEDSIEDSNMKQTKEICCCVKNWKW